MESFVTIAGAVSENVQRICGRTIGNEKMEEIAGRFAKGESIDSIYEEIIAGQ